MYNRVKFEDRVESYKQIQLYLEDIFKNHGKATMNLDEFTKLNTERTSESFLSVIYESL